MTTAPSHDPRARWRAFAIAAATAAASGAVAAKFASSSPRTKPHLRLIEPSPPEHQTAPAPVLVRANIIPFPAMEAEPQSPPATRLVTHRELAACALWLVAVTLASVAVLHNELFMLPIATIWIAAAALVWHRDDAYSLAAGIGFGALALGAGQTAFRFGLPHPASAADFVPALFAFSGSVATIALSTIALKLRIAARPDAALHAAKITIAGLALLAAVAVASIGMTLQSRASVASADRTGALPISMRNVRFEPSSIETVAGEPLKLVVRNDDLILHNITIPETNTNVEIGAGSEKLVELTFETPGTYAYVCTVPGHDAMRGDIAVQ